MPKLHDLVAFQRAVELSVQIYEVTKGFPKWELYGLTSQMRRAAIGVVSNIAEGQGRLTFGERRQLLSQTWLALRGRSAGRCRRAARIPLN